MLNSFCSVWLLALSVAILSANAVTSSDVISWTDDDYDTEMRKHEIAIVELYMPDCTHCKKFVCCRFV